jgi:hypothetical protein
MLRFGLLVCLLLGFGTRLAAQERLVLGTVLNDSTGRPVNLARVVNFRTQYLTRSDARGNFLISARPGDRLTITCSTCEERTATVDSHYTDLTLRVKQFVLPDSGTTLAEVEVRGKTEAEVKQEIKEFLKEPTTQRNLSGDDILGMAQSPFTLMYELFSKSAKARRRAAVMRQDDRRRQLAELRYNRLFVSQTTGLNGDELDEFMRICPVPDEFALRASDYELTERVKECYRRWVSRGGR